jgi:serine/threonine protein kinase/dienelactone hydrolase
MSTQPGQTLSHYRLIEKIGEGGMGLVYRAHDERLDRDVAIKVLPESVAMDPTRLARFEREAKAIAKLSHPNILEIFDFGREGDVTYSVTEFLSGEDLRECLKREDAPLSWTRAQKIAAAVASGLSAAHGHGVVHRDIKPSNIFLCRDGRIKILDFGLAAIRQRVESEAETASQDAPLTLEGKVLGTVGYTAPEQVRGHPADHRSDIFSFGCVLYEMVTGRRAFQAETAADTLSAILSHNPQPLSDYRLNLPTALQEVVDGCLAKRPADRFSSMEEVSRSMWGLREGASSASQNSTALLTTARSSRVFTALRKPIVVLSLFAVLVAVAIVTVRVLARHSADVWAREEAIPEILRLADEGANLQALMLARKVEDRHPESLLLDDVWAKVSVESDWKVTPKGADIFARSAEGPDTGWVFLGRSGDGEVRSPKGFWLYRFESPGYEPIEVGLADAWISFNSFDLPAEKDVPRGMTRIDTGGRFVNFWMNYLNHDRLRGSTMDTFFIDRFEVTNSDYRKFVDAGGYRTPEFWKEPFVKEGKVLTWDEAMELLRDTTGRPGPATWEVGSFPEGSENLPVGGVSWYEAAAYAEFVGKRLPTVYHWEVASGSQAGVIVPYSNFSGSLAEVGSYRGSVTLYGLHDTAGNVREWCSNPTGGKRFTLGGASDGPAYFFLYPEPREPFDRNATNGFRCMKQIGESPESEALAQPIAKKHRDSDANTPVIDDAGWATWLSFLAYPQSPLDARVEVTDESSPIWRMEKVTFSAAYDSDRVTAYLFLPKGDPPPYQTVVFWPGAYAWFAPTSDDGKGLADGKYWNYLVKDGRAVVYPILKGTFERKGSLLEGAQGLLVARDRLWQSKDLTVMKVKDISRTLDYLTTRSDIDLERVALLGFSSGGYQAPLPCAADHRFKVCLIVCGGAPYPDILGFAQRVEIPVQMVNGRYDSLLLYEEIQRPLFRAFSTPNEHKKHVVFETDHALSGFEKEMMRVNLEWLDRYLGSVR